jgi:hypothetical protein
VSSSSSFNVKPKIPRSKRSVSEAGHDMALFIAAVALPAISRYSRREQM